MSVAFGDPSQDSDWIERLKQSAGTDPAAYLLSNPGDVLVAEQLHCYPRAEIKFPEWHRDGLIYTRLALEQSSGERAAIHKASLIDGERLLDLTGGLGMDTYAFSRVFCEVVWSDVSAQALVLARHNHQILGAGNITHQLNDATEALNKGERFDWVYIDPSRRDPNKRFFRLKDCEPDVLALWENLRATSNGVMIKLSPMYDLRELRRELPEAHHIEVVSVNREVKEVLALVRFGAESTEISSADDSLRKTNKPQIRAVCLDRTTYVFPETENVRKGDIKDKQESGFSASTPRSRNIETDAIRYIYVPDPAIVKSGQTDAFASAHGLSKFAGFYCGVKAHMAPACLCYPVERLEPYKPKQLKRVLKGKRVHLHLKGLPDKPTTVYNRLGTSMGDDYHLFIGKDESGTSSAFITIFAHEALRNGT